MLQTHPDCIVEHLRVLCWADALFLVNGCGQAEYSDLGLTTTWADGFRVHFSQRAWERGISSAESFFDPLVSRLTALLTGYCHCCRHD